MAVITRPKNSFAFEKRINKVTFLKTTTTFKVLPQKKPQVSTCSFSFYNNQMVIEPLCSFQFRFDPLDTSGKPLLLHPIPILFY